MGGIDADEAKGTKTAILLALAAVFVFGFLYFVLGIAGRINRDSPLGQVFQVLAYASAGITVAACIYIPVVLIGSLIKQTRLPGSEGTITCEVTILNRFAVGDYGKMAFTDWEIETPGGELLVQVQLPDGRKRELHVPWEIFLSCGEGMKGMGVIQGHYLIGFVPPNVSAQRQPLPPDPFHPDR